MSDARKTKRFFRRTFTWKCGLWHWASSKTGLSIHLYDGDHTEDVGKGSWLCEAFLQTSEREAWGNSGIQDSPEEAFKLALEDAIDRAKIDCQDVRIRLGEVVSCYVSEVDRLQNLSTKARQ